jgi:hypothetical protein
VNTDYLEGEVLIVKISNIETGTEDVKLTELAQEKKN